MMGYGVEEGCTTGRSNMACMRHRLEEERIGRFVLYRIRCIGFKRIERAAPVTVFESN
jgi:hypothetical protein